MSDMNQENFLNTLQEFAKEHGNDYLVHYFIGWTKGELNSDKPSLKKLKAMYAAFEQYQDDAKSQIIPGYKDLTEEQQQLFERVHKRHMSAWESVETKTKYSKIRIKKLLWDAGENCLKVYYPDVWWHYDTKEEWY